MTEQVSKSCSMALKPETLTPFKMQSRWKKKKEREAQSKSHPVVSMLTRIPSRVRAPVILPNHRRSFQREQTFASATTVLGKALNLLYIEMVDVDNEKSNQVLHTTNEFINTIKYRINNNRHSLKFNEPFLGGPVLDGLKTELNYTHLDLYLPLSFKEFKLRLTIQGYTQVSMSKNPKYDRWETIRAKGHKILISSIGLLQAVHEIMDHVCTSTGLATCLPFDSNSSDYGEGTRQVIVMLGSLRLNVIPALQRTSKREPDTMLIVPKTYYYDMDTEDPTLWRYTDPTAKRLLLKAMDRADRGTRTKALRIVSVAHQLDPTLKLFPPDLIVCTLLNMFDKDVDLIPDWQTICLEKCFTGILTNWHQHLVSGHMINPNNEGMNLLARIPERISDLVKRRLIRLLLNKRELHRLLKLRP